MTMLPRLILMLALMFWQGGFMFYGSVVVTVGAQILGSELEQGFVTQSVTNYLNGAGATCLAVWSVILWRDGIHWRGWMLWAVLVASLAALVWLHVHLDARLDTAARVVTGNGFYQLHRLYLAISTAQLLIALTLLALTLRNWRQIDRESIACRGDLSQTA